MTDINQAETEEAPFDAEFAAFLGHSFADPGDVIEGEVIEKPGGEATTTNGAGEESKTAPAGADSIAGASGNDTVVSSSGAETSQQASGEDQIDPALLAEMAGLAGPGEQTDSAPAGQTGEESTTAPAGGQDSFMPFTPTFDLPPAIVQGLFEAEDTETRQKSLVGVLSAFGNTITSVVMAEADKRVETAIARYVESQSVANVGRAVTTHFYGKYSELAPYKQAVQKAFKVIASRNKDVTYTEEIAAQVANLAKASLKQAGVKFEAPASPPPPPKAAVRKAPGSGFDAGGARPGGGLETEADNGPQELVDQMRDFGFG